MVTYGNGVAEIDIVSLCRSHRRQGKLATVMAVRPSSRYRRIATENPEVAIFHEKPQVSEGWINGGFLFSSPSYWTRSKAETIH